MNQNEIVATPTAIEAASQFASMGCQQIDAEFARYEAEAAALKQRMDALKERRKGMRQQACNQALPEIVERMTTLGITLEQVRVALAAAKPAASVIDKYRNPETGETHSGKGGCPGWLTPEAKKDLRYRNPAWTAKDEAKKAAKEASEKSKTKSSLVSVADEAQASNDADPVPNDAATASNDALHDSTVNTLNPLSQSSVAVVA
jgi:DNA-binding protein H-NS